jgi:hypothetical protein
MCLAHGESANCFFSRPEANRSSWRNLTSALSVLNVGRSYQPLQALKQERLKASFIALLLMANVNPDK